jgi:hypothetical protein
LLAVKLTNLLQDFVFVVSHARYTCLWPGFVWFDQKYWEIFAGTYAIVHGTDVFCCSVADGESSKDHIIVNITPQSVAIQNTIRTNPKQAEFKQLYKITGSLPVSHSQFHRQGLAF